MNKFILYNIQFNSKIRTKLLENIFDKSKKENDFEKKMSE